MKVKQAAYNVIWYEKNSLAAFANNIWSRVAAKMRLCFISKIKRFIIKLKVYLLSIVGKVLTILIKMGLCSGPKMKIGTI